MRQLGQMFCHFLFLIGYFLLKLLINEFVFFAKKMCIKGSLSRGKKKRTRTCQVLVLLCKNAHKSTHFQYIPNKSNQAFTIFS